MVRGGGGMYGMTSEEEEMELALALSRSEM
jgi:hypothetical protein